MPPADNPAIYLAAFGEPVAVQGTATTAIVNTAAELALGEHIVTGIAITLPASVAAAEGGAVTLRGAAHVIRQVMPLPPDGVWQQLVLARS